MLLNRGPALQSRGNNIGMELTANAMFSIGHDQHVTYHAHILFEWTQR